jgi:hypothetical protein
MRLRPVLLLAVTLASLGTLVASSACSNQGEGEFCDPNNGNNGSDDCQDGLVCKPAPGLVGVNTSRCCPMEPSLAKTAACAEMAGNFDAGHESPEGSVVSAVDAGPDGEAGAVAEGGGLEASNEASAEASTEGGPTGADAAIDGGADGAPE